MDSRSGDGFVFWVNAFPNESLPTVYIIDANLQQLNCPSTIFRVEKRKHFDKAS